MARQVTTPSGCHGDVLSAAQIEEKAARPTRPRVIKWYCPFADQASFPSGHRYRINVYTGCSHGCEYCYAAAYQPQQPNTKRDFPDLLQKDLADLDRYDVPPAPIHLSSSTDPFQPLEATAGHTRLALQAICECRHRFTSVVVLTKNPRLAVDQGCTDILNKLAEPVPAKPKSSASANMTQPPFCMEDSVAFWRDEVRQVLDPHAPSIGERLEGIQKLRKTGVPIVLRIDPLFPQVPMTDTHDTGTVTYDNYDLPQPQTLNDLEHLVAFARELSVQHVVYSPAKIVQPRGRSLSPVMQRMRMLYESIAAPERLTFRGGSWRLPSAIQSATTAPLLDLCHRYTVPTNCCKQNLIETP